MPTQATTTQGSSASKHETDTKTDTTPYSLKVTSGRAFTVLIIAFMIFGWIMRGDNYISAETGIGYTLGIVGGVMMLVVVLYPLSKRNRLLTRWVPVRYWFGIHMFLGIVGPLIILFHSNFQIGSINSTVALICMLLVAGSGLIGRYIYRHIHHGLYGERITLSELKTEVQEEHGHVFDSKIIGEKLAQKLDQIEQKALEAYTGIFDSLRHVMYLGSQSGLIKRQLTRSLKDNPQHREATEAVGIYLVTLRRIAAFKLYERLFSLWHILHLPLFIMMIITAIIHIFAVHMY